MPEGKGGRSSQNPHGNAGGRDRGRGVLTDLKSQRGVAVKNGPLVRTPTNLETKTEGFWKYNWRSLGLKGESLSKKDITSYQGGGGSKGIRKEKKNLGIK